MLEQAWAELSISEEFAGLGLDEKGRSHFIGEAYSLLEHYLALEDPTAVQTVGIELDLRARLGTIEMRGIIDRLDRLPNGDFVLVDYKTGRSPRAEGSRGRLVGVQFYAYLCEQVLGIRPREVRLDVFEGPSCRRRLADRSVDAWFDPARHSRVASDRSARVIESDFRPNPTPLCKKLCVPVALSCLHLLSNGKQVPLD